MDVKTAVEKIKELVRKGNVSKIVVRRKGEVLLSIPVNVGVVGAVIGLTAAKWAVLAAVLGTVGFGCSVEIVKDDGEVVNVVTEEDTQKAKDTAAGVIQDVRRPPPGWSARSRRATRRLSRKKRPRTPTSSRSWTTPSPRTDSSQQQKRTECDCIPFFFAL